MTYQIIARKYRPQNFKQVVGQEKIITILRNALKNNRIGQAYLFSGPRGIGKTTTARILVKFLNCEKKSTSIPCNQCINCEEINRGASLDYLEIDGASNRGIDQIRALNEQLNFASPTGKYRVFVIDEVHMLTNEAFNALLKSLEEPPAKFIFILCTTENHRIPLTIRSRCQQLFFSNIDSHLIEKHLEVILQKENIPFEPNSLFNLAKKSEGSIRDAENLLEKTIAYTNNQMITESIIMEVLGETAIEKKYDFLTHLFNQKIKENYQLLKQLIVDGYNLTDFLYNLIETLSNLAYYKSGIRDRQSLEISNEDLEKLKGLEKFFTLNEIFTLSDIFFEFIKTLKNSSNSKTITYYLLLKIHRYQKLITPEELKENMLELSKYIIPDEKFNNLETQNLRPNPSHSQIVNPSQVNSPPKNPKEMETEKSQNQVETTITESPWDEQQYQNLIENQRENDVELFRLFACLKFLRVENNILFLENKEQLSVEKIKIVEEKLLPLIDQKSKLSHLKKIFKISIEKNIVQSNLEKIKKIFPQSDIIN